MRIKSAVVAVLLHFGCYAQVDPTAYDENGARSTESSILGNASLATPANPVLPPRIGLRTYKLSANIGGNSYLDFYVLNNLPTLVTNSADSLQVLSNELLNQAGGVLNIAFGKMDHFGDSLNDGVKGLHYDLRAGAKLIDPPTRSYAEFLVPTFQSSLDIRYLIPLLSSAKSPAPGDKSTKAKLVGNLAVRAIGTYQKVFNEEIYNDYYKTPKGNPSPTDVFTYGYEISLFISDAFYISYGQSFSNISTMPSRTMFALSYMGSGK